MTAQKTTSTMTPNKILDMTVKFGVVPFMFYILMLTRSDVEELREKLYDCYEDQIKGVVKSPAVTTSSYFAVLPEKFKLRIQKL